MEDSKNKHHTGHIKAWSSFHMGVVKGSLLYAFLQQLFFVRFIESCLSLS